MYKITDPQVIKIIKRYHDGERAKALAEEYNITEKTVLGYVKLNSKDISDKDTPKRSVYYPVDTRFKYRIVSQEDAMKAMLGKDFDDYK